MSLIDSLLKIFPELKKVNLKNIVKIHFGINIGNKIKITNNTYKFDYHALPEEQQKSLLKTLPEEINKDNDLLEEKFEEKTQDYKNVISESSNREILIYFNDKLPPSDLPILKASLYLKYLLESGKETGNIKQDITMRYGRRGNNISNLCSANYFQTWIKPLYEEMKKSSEFSKEKFYIAYNEIVENSPFALFVNKYMNKEEVKKEIKLKIEQMRKYGVENLNIHGIGEKNIECIRNAIVELADIKIFEKRIEEEGNIIVVRLKKK